MVKMVCLGYLDRRASLVAREILDHLVLEADLETLDWTVYQELMD